MRDFRFEAMKFQALLVSRASPSDRDQIDTIANKLMQNDDTKFFMGDFPANLCAGKHLLIIYTNIIEYQYVDNAKVLLLRVIDSEEYLKN